MTTFIENLTKQKVILFRMVLVPVFMMPISSKFIRTIYELDSYIAQAKLSSFFIIFSVIAITIICSVTYFFVRKKGVDNIMYNLLLALLGASGGLLGLGIYFLAKSFVNYLFGLDM